MEENESRKAAEKAKKAALGEPAGPYDGCTCGCDTLENIKARQTLLEAEFNPGDPGLAEEIMSMSTCFQSCMGEFMRCKQ